MSEQNGNGSNRILTLEQAASQRNAKDEKGRLLRHNATVLDAHQIAVEEGTKIHEFYMNQIPPFVARMIQDALLGFGLIQLGPEAQLAATPTGQPGGEPAATSDTTGASPAPATGPADAPAPGSEPPEPPRAHGPDCPITHGNFLSCTCDAEP